MKKPLYGHKSVQSALNGIENKIVLMGIKIPEVKPWREVNKIMCDFLRLKGARFKTTNNWDNLIKNANKVQDRYADFCAYLEELKKVK